MRLSWRSKKKILIADEILKYILCISFPSHMACHMPCLVRIYIWIVGVMSRVARLDKLPWNDNRMRCENVVFLCWHHPIWLIWKFIWFETIPAWFITSTKAKSRREVRSGSDPCKIIFMRKRLEAEKEIEIEKCLTYLTCATARVFSSDSSFSHRSWSWHLCNCPAWIQACVGMCGMSLLLILHFKLKKKSSDDHDFELPKGQLVRVLLRELQLLSRYADVHVRRVKTCLLEKFASLCNFPIKLISFVVCHLKFKENPKSTISCWCGEC
jgi:hypothetical protein